MVTSVTMAFVGSEEAIIVGTVTVPVVSKCERAFCLRGRRQRGTASCVGHHLLDGL